MTSAIAYTRVFVSEWEAFSCAGNSVNSYTACINEKSALTKYSWGYGGHSPQHTGSLIHFLGDCAQACLSTAPIENPILCVSSSKGSLRDLLATPEHFLRSLPGMLGPQVAQLLKIDHYIGYPAVAACSTGLNTLLSAADLLEAGHSEQALCGSADASLEPFLLGAYKNLGVLAQQAPQAFSDQHTGFAAAEGAAFMNLNRNNGPWRLCGGVRLADASHITRCESDDVILQCFESLWELLPKPDLIVTHATGTENSDTFEGHILNNGAWKNAHTLNCKPIIGHCLGASGLVELAIGLHAPVQRLWKISLGFGGHLAAVALERT